MPSRSNNKIVFNHLLNLHTFPINILNTLTKVMKSTREKKMKAFLTPSNTRNSLEETTIYTILDYVAREKK